MNNHRRSVMYMDKTPYTFPHVEIVSLAIIALSERCVKMLDRIRLSEQNTPEYTTTMKAVYAELFFKMRKLLEYYKLETGKDYELEALCGLSPTDLDMTKGATHDE